MQQRRRLADIVLLALDLLPDGEERLDFAPEMVLGDPFGHGANDHPAGVRRQVLRDHLAELGPLFATLDLARHADLGGVGHVHQEATGQRDLRGDPAPLGGDRFLGDLDREGLALLEHLADVGHGATGADLTAAALAAPLGRGDYRGGATALGLGGFGRLGGIGHVGIVGGFLRLLLVLGFEEVGGVQEGRLALADVDERRLDAGQHCLDPAQVDVADATAMIGTIDQQLDELVVLEDRHPRLARGTGDEDFALHGRPGRDVVARGDAGPMARGIAIAGPAGWRSADVVAAAVSTSWWTGIVAESTGRPATTRSAWDGRDESASQPPDDEPEVIGGRGCRIVS